MKKSILSTLFIGALGGTSYLPFAAYAVETEFEFHGYFRAGFFASKENDFKKADFAGQKEMLGRLGIEPDNDGGIDFITKLIFDDEKQLSIHVGLSEFDADDVLGFIEFEGVTPSGSMWAGKRKIYEDNYIFMTDYFYTDLEGIGAGISDYEIGDGFLSLAYLSSDRSEDYEDLVDATFHDPSGALISTWEEERYRIITADQKDAIQSNLNNTMHTFSVGYQVGRYEVIGNYKYMPDNWDVFGNEWADTGFDVTGIYHMPHFFGLEGNAFSYVIAQTGKGLGSGNLLGSTITDYSGYRPGSLTQGVHNDWPYFGPSSPSVDGLEGYSRNTLGGNSEYLLTHRHEDATSGRLLLWGGYVNSSGIGFFPAIQGQYNDEAGKDDTTYTYWYSAMMRNTFPVADNFFVQTDIGWYKQNYNGNSSYQSKYTVAPTFIMSDGESSAEIRFMVTYLPESWTNESYVRDANGDIERDPDAGYQYKTQNGSDVIVGIQADVYW
ncbi:carbohydrate porin [Grimontia sp. NTOU-MAR1]|uniref:carbohydrate porin n=1 Tax=Grimontia sp. NTOU-MAR1 TaxID=3111011 RepID=UPI002DC0525E|nr:carbohydrate porin [Grimontia sp. NTOU-MAR1]WRW00344.1 carbohydrate porin [Grimontia sp. NTOU-MAR1]